MSGGLNKHQREVLKLIQTMRKLTVLQISMETGFNVTKVEGVVSHLLAFGYIRIADRVRDSLLLDEAVSYMLDDSSTKHM